MQKLPLFYSVLLAGPTIALYVYYIVGQTFVCVRRAQPSLFLPPGSAALVGGCYFSLTLPP